MNRLKKDDTVVFISGKEKGKKGTVLQVLPNDKIIVKDLNLVVKSTKPSKDSEGGLIKKPSPVHSSNLMLVISDSPSKVSFKILNDKKNRVSRGNKND